MKRQYEPRLLKPDSKKFPVIPPLIKTELTRSELVANWISGLPTYQIKKCAKTEMPKENIENSDHLNFITSVIYQAEDCDAESSLIAYSQGFSNDGNFPKMVDKSFVNLDLDSEENTEETENDWVLPIDHKVYTLVDYPPDTVTLDAAFTAISMAQHLESGGLVKILITQIVGTFRFWFLLRKMRKIFVQKMEQLSKEYNALKGGELIMASTHVFPGQICALYAGDSHWARGVIQNYLLGSTVMVLLVDYGVVLSVPPKELRYLKTEYMELPQQAIRGTLAYDLLPTNMKIGKKVFTDITSGKVFDCNVIRIKKFADQKVCHLGLFTRHARVDICKFLVDKGYAKYAKRETRVFH